MDGMLLFLLYPGSHPIHPAMDGMGFLLYPGSHPIHPALDGQGVGEGYFTHDSTPYILQGVGKGYFTHDSTLEALEGLP